MAEMDWEPMGLWSLWSIPTRWRRRFVGSGAFWGRLKEPTSSGRRGSRPRPRTSRFHWGRFPNSLWDFGLQDPVQALITTALEMLLGGSTLFMSALALITPHRYWQHVLQLKVSTLSANVRCGKYIMPLFYSVFIPLLGQILYLYLIPFIFN
jgi:hypothetical protein